MDRRALVLACLACTAAACKHEQPVAPPRAAQEQPAQDPHAAWRAVVDAPDRSETDRKLDPGRHPAEMLEFLDVKPGMKVADLGAGGGYTTELLARAVGPTGVVYMQNDPSWLGFLQAPLMERFEHAAMKQVKRADAPFSDPLPLEKDLDEVVLNTIYHDIANMPVDRVRMNRLIFNALQPGGRYVVIDSSAKDGTGLRDTQTLHRIDEAVVKAEVEKAGFKLLAEANFLRNPQDARDWNSSPGAATRAGKRGQSDRFALKFVRPEGSQAQLIPPSLRIPSGVSPTHVTAELTVDPTQSSFQGTEVIDLAVEAPTKVLWLNADGLQITQTEPPSQLIDVQQGFVGLQFQSPLGKGETKLRIDWRGKLSSTDTDGAFREQENGEWYAMTHLEPTGARRVWPSFDEPSFKIPWKMSLRVRKADAAYFNTAVESTEDAGDQKLVHFAETKPLPSYLLAFAVGPYERLDAGAMHGGQPVGIIVTKGKLPWAKYSAQSSPKLMNLLQDYFGVPYHYPKLDLFEVPLGTGAMENPGLISFNQRVNLARPGTETPQFDVRAAQVEAHEFAHLWFGDMVTTAWWDDIWLNEAFATWGSAKIIQRFQPAWAEDADRAQATEAAMQADQLLSARRIRQAIYNEGDIKTAFDSITYQKGSAVIGMFEQWVGPDKFQKGVHRYLTEHADKNATAQDFLQAVSAEAGKDVAPAFSSFLDQPGLPLVTMKVVCNEEKPHLELAQYRYLALGVQPRGTPHWQIPICVRTDKGTTCSLLESPTTNVDLPSCPKWMMPNAAAAGYYRSALDDASQAQLTKNLSKLTGPEKMRFFYDTDAVAHAGGAEYSRTFEVMTKLASDKERHVVQALLPAVSFARESGVVANDEGAKYAAFVRKTFGQRARSLGFTEHKGDSMDARILRPLLLRIAGDEGGDTALRGQAQKLALRWLSDHSAASPELASAALYLAAIDGDASLYDRYLAAAKAEHDRQDRQRILDAMGRFRDPELVRKGFQIYLSDQFDPRESYTLVSGPSRHFSTREEALDFAEKNFDTITSRMPRDFGGQVPQLGSGFCDEEHAAAMESFFSARARNFAGGERRLAQTLEQVRQCAAFKEKAQPSLAAFLGK
ncbi:MAG TPA: M1 family aminopeptidase [Myxococcales bacterium]